MSNQIKTTSLKIKTMKKLENIRFIFGVEDYVKANKIASRNDGLANGFVAKHKVHKNKKAYDRKRDKKVIF